MNALETAKVAYTPGPWGLDRDGDVRSSHTPENGYASEYVATLLFQNYRYERIEERLPNARLISAAPELLIFLMEAIEGWEGHGWTSDQGLGEHEQERVKLAKAAVSKALGLD